MQSVKRLRDVRLLALLAVICCGGCVDPSTPDEFLPRKPLLSTLRLRSSRYPPVQLRHDDATVEFGRTVTGGPWQLASLFRNPYPVPARVDTMWLWIGSGTGPGAFFQFALWDSDASQRPAADLELTPVLQARAPFGTWGLFRNWTTVLPPGALFGAGMRQLSSDPVVIGHDTTRPFRNDTFFVALNNVNAWLSFEQLGVTDEVPMVRVSLSPVHTAQPVDAPTPKPKTEDDYIVLESPFAPRRVPVGAFVVPAARSSN